MGDSLEYSFFNATGVNNCLTEIDNCSGIDDSNKNCLKSYNVNLKDIFCYNNCSNSSEINSSNVNPECLSCFAMNSSKVGHIRDNCGNINKDNYDCLSTFDEDGKTFSNHTIINTGNLFTCLMNNVEPFMNSNENIDYLFIPFIVFILFILLKE